jgi:hypothetical protein
LQGALGYEITQALFVGENTLVVEGPSDLLYLKAFSSRLAAKGRTGLSPRWTICPVGGVDKVPAFVGLFGGRHLKVAVLVDLAGGQKKKVEELRRQGEVLQQNGVFTYAGITNKAESDVEDMLGDELYITLVNRALSLPATRKIAVPADSPLRIVKYVEEAVRLLPDLPLFDHYSPAEHFIQMGPKSTDKLPGIADADARFERLFVQLNGLV